MKKNLLILLVFVIASCKDKPKITSENKIDDDKEIALNIDSITQDAQRLLETKCYICHDPEASHDQRIAPPMAAIKARYLKDYSTKKEFTDAIWAFVEKPTKEKTKMRGAVNRFGVMPYQPYEEEEIRLISNFIFEYKIEEPAWFKKHWEEGHGNGNYRQKGMKMGDKGQQEKNYTEKGLAYANNTKKVLGKNLMGTIQKKGTVAALSFCNERAYPLTDSLANVYNAEIRRVSDQPRNPNNKASTSELEHIKSFKNAIASGEKYDPIVVEGEEKINFYYPIVTNSMCLQCHGKIEADIQPEVVNILKSKYPNDKAVGYTTNEVRGIWSIAFDKEIHE
jgi:cytochrome c553